MAIECPDDGRTVYWGSFLVCLLLSAMCPAAWPLILIGLMIRIYIGEKDKPS